MKQKIPPPEDAVVKPLHRGDPALVHSLPWQEYEVYLWLLQAYSIDWISETLGLEKRAVKALAGNVYTRPLKSAISGNWSGITFPRANTPLTKSRPCPERNWPIRWGVIPINA
jgi:hypothetical protein